MNILVTLDKNYLEPLKVLITSLLLNNPGGFFDIYVASDDLTDDDLADVQRLCNRYESRIYLIRVEDDLFANAPTLRYYSRAMYYRLLAAQMLPKELDRILYLDPDMLVINPIRPLYETDMGDNLYAACIHKGLVNISKPVNQVRLST
ncbi:MAG: glycosyltransferase family 8 protein, partial [Clostridia bacterium]|nr:glycosyltransferase family 8 protein [Clostridia bacterium]